MRKSLLIALLLLSPLAFRLSPLVAQTQKVVRLESLTGSDEDYTISELQRVEFVGDSIRFIAKDGSVVAEVYKYDYAKLMIAEQEPTTIDEQIVNPQSSHCKFLLNGQVFILRENKIYTIQGQEVASPPLQK